MTKKAIKKEKKVSVSVDLKPLEVISPKERVRLEALIKQNDLDIEEVMKTFEGAIAKIKDTTGMTKDMLDRIGVSAVYNEERRKKKRLEKPKRETNIVSIYGFLAGDAGIFDKADTIRKTAKSFIDRNGLEAAKEAQLIDGDNKILDQRAEIFGKTNPNYLKPLPENFHDRNRTLYGFFKNNGEKVFKFTTLQTADNKLARAWDQVHFHEPCQTVGILKEENEETMRLNSSQAEGTETIFRALKEDWPIEDIVKDYCAKNETPIKDVEKVHEETKKEWNRIVWIRGIVAWVNTDRPTPWGAVWMCLMDPENEEQSVNVLIPQHLSVDFGELSELIVFGKTRRNKNRDRDTGKTVEGDVIIDLYGYLPLLKAPKVQETETEEENIEGWLD